MSEALRLGEKAREASRILAATSTAVRDRALLAMSHALSDKSDEILSANAKDMESARARGTAPSLLDRLELDPMRVKAMAEAVKDLASLPDPIGEVVAGHRLPNGIALTQVRVPLGVVAIIYEARPNVTADAAALCVKTGNAVLLRGGSLAINSCLALSRVLAQAALGAGLPKGTIASIESTDYAEVNELMGLHGYVDVLIPRGGAGLIKSVVENAKVPVIETGVGNCHVYVHESADFDMAQRIVINAKCQRPGVCNAAETLLVDESVHAQALPPILKALESEGVEIIADEPTRSLGAVTRIRSATE